MVGVSVVTIALNAAEHLPLTLESAILQDHDDLEIIVVDGMSWDGTGAVLRRYAGAVNTIAGREDSGIYHAMNDALELVSKPYVIFMNAGDRFYCREAVSRMVAAIEGEPDIFYGNHIYVDGRLELFRRSAPFDLIAGSLADGVLDATWLDTIPAHQATFTKADLLRTLRYDTRLRVSADHELLFRAHAAGAAMQFVDELVCHYVGGGFSVAMGERTKLEGVSVYRRFSDHPEVVDRLFYPHGSPFEPQTRRTGIKLDGFFAGETWPRLRERSRGGDWVSEGGCRFLSPQFASSGIELSGYNEVADQRMDFLLDGQVIASTSLPLEHFRIEVGFDRPVQPSSTITLRPARSKLIDDAPPAMVAMAIRAFRFLRPDQPAAAAIQPGSSLLFQSGQASRFLHMLGTGWSDPENTHLWGVGPQSDLWLKATGDAARVRFTVSGNPHVPDGRQRIELLVNSIPVAAVDVDHGDRATVEIDCGGDAWRPGTINRVSFRPSSIARPPLATGDARALSICLWRLDIL